MLDGFESSVKTDYFKYYTIYANKLLCWEWGTRNNLFEGYGRKLENPKCLKHSTKILPPRNKQNQSFYLLLEHYYVSVLFICINYVWQCPPIYLFSLWVWFMYYKEIELFVLLVQWNYICLLNSFFSAELVLSLQIKLNSVPFPVTRWDDLHSFQILPRGLFWYLSVLHGLQLIILDNFGRSWALQSSLLWKFFPWCVKPGPGSDRVGETQRWQAEFLTEVPTILPTITRPARSKLQFILNSR